MGYYTRFNLEIIEGEDKNGNYISEIGDINNCGDDWEEDEMKWYDFHQDMLTYSLRHPDTTFKLIGEGEESGDNWANYYKNGKCQETRAVIIYEEFDELKLI